MGSKKKAPKGRTVTFTLTPFDVQPSYPIKGPDCVYLRMCHLCGALVGDMELHARSHLVPAAPTPKETP